MAKKTPAKAPKIDPKAMQNTIAAYALERAGKAVGKLPTVELAPGSYPFALEVNITGELLVQNGTEARPGTPPTYGTPLLAPAISANDVLVGLVASLPPDERDRMISNAFGEIKSAKPEQIEEYRRLTDEVCLRAAKKRKMTVEVPNIIDHGTAATAAKKGAVLCKPSVLVKGSSGTQVIEVEVAA